MLELISVFQQHIKGNPLKRHFEGKGIERLAHCSSQNQDEGFFPITLARETKT